MKIKTLSLFVLISFVLINAQESNTDPYKFEIKKIAKDIYVAHRPDLLRILVEGNSTIIINENDVVVVDATGSPRGARQIIKEIKKLTNKPVRYLINTHGHGDHTLGNQEFIKSYPGCEIIARKETRDYLSPPEGSKKGISYVYSIRESIASRQQNTKDEIERVANEAKPGYKKIIKKLEQYMLNDLPVRRKEYQEVEVTPPTLVFEDKLILYRGDREIQILYMGKGDTPSDVWVYLPKEKLICTGDALVHPIPYGFSRNPFKWVETLKKVEKMDIEIMVPGHGEVQYDKEYINLVISALDEIHSQVKSYVDKGMNLEQITGAVSIPYIKEKFTHGDPLYEYFFDVGGYYSYFLEAVIFRTYSKLTGKTK